MRFSTLAVAAILTLLGGSAAAQDVTYDFDKSADFSRFQTYTWVRGTNLNDELNHKRIMDAVDAQLAAKGLRKVGMNEKPDVFVAYHAGVHSDLQVSGLNSGWGGYRVGSNRLSSARVEEIPMGTLVVNIVDAGTRAIVWRGIANKEIDTKASPEKRDKNINKTAEKLFRNYPPKA